MAAAPERSRIYPSGICSVCGARRQVRGDGTVRKHVNPNALEAWEWQDGWERDLPCEGSDKPPKT